MRGRDPNLALAVRGLFSNPMNQAHASMIPLQTVAEYLWNPHDYDPDQSHHRAVREQYGEDSLRLLAPFLETYGDYWWQKNVFTPLYVEERTRIDAPLMERRAAALESSVRSLDNPSLAGRECFQKLLPELSPFVTKTRQRLDQVRADPAFHQLPEGALLWSEDYDVLHATRVSQTPKLDGDFAKWQGATIVELREPSQIVSGSDSWKGQEQF
jgi:hypothetical protein